MDFTQRLKETCRQVLGLLIRGFGLYLGVSSLLAMLFMLSIGDRFGGTLSGTSTSYFFSSVFGAVLFVLADTLVAITYRKTSAEFRAERAASRS